MYYNAGSSAALPVRKLACATWPHADYTSTVCSGGVSVSGKVSGPVGLCRNVSVVAMVVAGPTCVTDLPRSDVKSLLEHFQVQCGRHSSRCSVHMF
jgi:hypothetical protein